MRLITVFAASLVTVATAGYAQTAAPAPVVNVVPSVDPGQEIVCRKVKETGSLIKAKKTCHSKAQWAYIDDQNQTLGRKMVEDGTTRPAGN
jgi:molybdenum-dependent DNA-binding transcriptional regulator ModE